MVILKYYITHFYVLELKNLQCSIEKYRYILKCVDTKHKCQNFLIVIVLQQISGVV